MLDAAQSAPGVVPGADFAVVLWSGNYGGAERWSLELAKALRRAGHTVGVVVVSDPRPLCDPMHLDDVPCAALRLNRGSSVIFHARTFARAVLRLGRRAAIVPSAGYMSAALRLGGYRGRIVAVEHGGLLQWGGMPAAQRLVRRLDWASGIGAVDVQVTPSDFMRRELLKHWHCRRVIRIYPGLDVSLIRGPNAREDDGHGADEKVVFGCASRLTNGKGLDVLLRALAACPASIHVRIAGDGPERKRLEQLREELSLTGRVEFPGWVSNMSAFWTSCDVGVVPSYQLTESFGMVAIEAMTHGLPVLASRRGGLAEIVQDGTTGSLFEPGDWNSLARLMEEYATNTEMRRTRGSAAREACVRMFDIDRCAMEFETLLTDRPAA